MSKEERKLHQLCTVSKATHLTKEWDTYLNTGVAIKITKCESTPEILLKSCKKIKLRKFLSSGIWRRVEWQGKWVPIEEKRCLHLKLQIAYRWGTCNPDDSHFLSHCPQKNISHVQIEKLIKKLSIRDRMPQATCTLARRISVQLVKAALKFNLPLSSVVTIDSCNCNSTGGIVTKLCKIVKSYY